MNFKQLTAFREVMLTGSVSEAARNLFRTQPAISSQLSSLERELGNPLFVRRSGRLHPMPEAHYLFEEASSILDQLSATERNMKSLHELKSGMLTIVCMPGPSVFFLPKLISEFVKDHEDIDVKLITRTSRQVEQIVSSQHYDVGLADGNLTTLAYTSLLEHDIVDCDCLCAMPINDPLANKDFITPQDLSGRPVSSLYSDHPLSAKIVNAFQLAGAEYNLRFEAQFFIPLFTFVENGLAYAIVDAISANSYSIYKEGNEKLIFKPMRPNIPLTVSIMTPSHRPTSNLAKAFTDFLRTELRCIANCYPNKKTPSVAE
ncbi:MAG: LysR substrate-binding domain-containing protein [Amylibacter sp.]